MPLIAERNHRHLAGIDCVRIALVNNMPDSALEDTEMQFMGLLNDACGALPVSLSLYSLPEVARGERAQQRIHTLYRSIGQLWTSNVDAVIVTGTEPRQADLRQEPYWPSLTAVLDWAERNTVSTVLSCLAAHAAVLHSDGIPREPLGDKLFGIFKSQSADHQLTSNAARPLRFPHSRWNDVSEASLIAGGYSILTKSAEAGVDLFVKRRKKSLFVHLQGHPEYSTQTLLKEYRRDVKRFLRQERETYPAMPRGYFDAATEKLFAAFQEIAIADRREEVMASFPTPGADDSLANSWSETAHTVYRNWLQYVESRSREETALAALARSSQAAVTAAKELS